MMGKLYSYKGLAKTAIEQEIKRFSLKYGYTPEWVEVSDGEDISGLSIDCKVCKALPKHNFILMPYVIRSPRIFKGDRLCQK